MGYPGAPSLVHEMVHGILCYFYSGCVGLGSSDLRHTNQVRRSSYRCMDMVHRVCHGRVHRAFRLLAFLYIRQIEALLTLTVAELVSAYPTAGGMYFVTKHVVPPEHVAFWAWIVGWCNFLGQTAGVTSVAFSVSQMMLAAASMRSAFVDGSYSFSP